MSSASLTGLKGLAAIAVLLLAADPSAAKYRATVQSGDRTVEQAPVSVQLPEAWDVKAIVVKDEASGEETPGQLDEIDGKPAVSWIVPKLEAGSTRKFVLSEGKPANWSDEYGVKLTESDDGLVVTVDGEEFTTYQTSLGPKPYLWPIIGPSGKAMTRDFPMRDDTAGERHDHPHHRSFWFTFDKVNDHDFWSESPRAGKSVHQKYEKSVSGPVFGEFQSLVYWISKEGEKVCQDVRNLRVWRVPGARVIDTDLRWQATEGEIKLGDSKEGLFAVRVAGTMKSDQRGNVDGSMPEGGTLLNSNGEKDGDTWGKRAEWCDYYGPVGGEIVGLAIFDNPGNFRHPTYWHSRTYGLFAANPLGISHFTNNKENDGSHVIPAGEELRLRYRVYIHKGDTRQANVATHYAAYANPPKVQLE